MEHYINFKFETTRYSVWRQGEWGFFVSIAPATEDSVHFDLELWYRDLTTVFTPRRYALRGDEIDLVTERFDGSEEVVTVWLESRSKDEAVIGFELPNGAQIRFLEERSLSHE